MKTVNYKWLLYIYTLVVILLAVLPINGTNSVLNHTFVIHIRLDYLAHFFVYIPWVFLLWKTTGTGFRKNTGLTLFYILISLVFASANEGVQYFLSYRAYNINDLLANVMGVLIGSIVFVL